MDEAEEFEVTDEFYVQDAIAQQTGGLVINYIAVACYIDEDGQRQWYYEADGGAEPWEILGLLKYAEMVETNPIPALMEEDGE